MDWHVWPALWCGVFGLVALVGYARSLAGMTRAQREVRVVGRVERVREPRHGSSPGAGIDVVVTYRDPATGQARTVTNDDENGETITAAWVGREIGVRYPPGRPHAYRLTAYLDDSGRGLGWPSFAVVLVYAGLVTFAAIGWAWPWALIGVGVPAAILTACYLPGATSAARRRLARLDAMSAVPGRVVAVLKRVSTEDGHTSTRLVPVVAFTTLDGTAVTAHLRADLPDPAHSNGRAVTIHYAPDDPAVFTTDVEAERRAQKADPVIVVLILVVLVGIAVAGAIAL